MNTIFYGRSAKKWDQEIGKRIMENSRQKRNII